ncbi:C2H2-type zinc finger-containing protein [Cavenderia fasciculata]|uniref:C2H2-type zinc finger-containing protein n=1 Tax=Cavenderia fasciculata TaxID=261658 RepID=F4Q019_CACFS|nr:C2H2-type zinc finger-containing protein [Cavenderia fasciculata]EGG18933.1 C2H2-type zinc finger-containing protein [Cavenderia fasciculata]|eukprot:XP_004357395.1 C2H2-type zinc finger-containing protein [Cavenderia fasciculata]
MSDKKDFIDSTFRKKWDREYYEQRARDREAGILVDEDDDAAERSLKKAKPAEELVLYKARDQDLNLKSRLGKNTVIEGVTPADQQGGLYCQLCERGFKDSNTFLDHFNGKRHTRLSGSSMHVPQASLSQVQAKLQQGKESLLIKKQAPTVGGGGGGSSTTSSLTKNSVITNNIKAQTPAYQRIMKSMQDKKKQQQEEDEPTTTKNEKDEKEEEEEDEETKIMKQMGIPGNFGSSTSTKNNNINNNNSKQLEKEKENNNNGNNKNIKENIKENNNIKQPEEKEEKEVEQEQEEEEEEDDEETKMMKMMGIPSNFGTSKKR